jgi:hypothetical protein
VIIRNRRLIIDRDLAPELERAVVDAGIKRDRTPNNDARPPDFDSTVKLRERLDEMERQSAERDSVPPTPMVDLTEREAIEIADVVMRKAPLLTAFNALSPEKLQAFVRAAIRGVRKP